MADNQMVKIDFQFDLGNVPASTKAFTNYLKDLGVNLKFTKASTDALAASVEHLSTAQKQASITGEAAANSLKKSNQQWTNFALIIQDLPYGFRGIQNNLPAVVGGFAGMTGGIYFAASAVIAFFTAWDSGIIKFGNSVKLTTDYAKEAATAYSNESVQLDSLYRVATNVNGTMDDRIKAAKTLKEEYPGLLGLYSAEDIALGKADVAYKKLTTTLWQYAKAKAAEKSLQEIATEQNKLTIEKTDLLNKYTDSYLNSLSKQEGYMTVGNQLVKVESAYNAALSNKINLLAKNKKAYDELEVAAQKFVSISDQNINAGGDLAGMKGQSEAYKAAEAARKKALADALAKAKAAKAIRDKELEELRVANNTAALDLLDSQSKEERIVIDKYTKLLNLAAKYGQDTTVLEEGQQKELFNIRKIYEDKEYQRNQDSINANIAAESKFYNDSMKIWDDNQKKKADGQAKYTNDYVNSMELQLRTELKLHRNSVTLMEEDIKNKIKQLEVARIFAFGNQQSLAIIDKAINGLKAQLTGLGNVATAVQGILNSTITQGFEALGETIGNLVLTGKLDFSSLGNILADALIQIGKALIMYSALVKAAKDALEKGQFKAGLVIGVLAIAAGVALKGSLNKKKDTASPKAFADGGIISGPTMGLMGEYPGAKSNPEVVAPLDKLKGLIGGGTLTTKISGNDLYIIMNKASQNRNTIF